MTPHLSADWFRLWKAALGEAMRLDVNIGIYDENSYPWGFAGGYVPDAMPASRGRGLHFREEKQPGKAGADVVGLYRLTRRSEWSPDRFTTAQLIVTTSRFRH